ncbi:MAG: hypothetical protein Q8R88_07470 [Desulfoprunum sp.]|nr:hypothetical protein [Desulfoprunum sp.]
MNTMIEIQQIEPALRQSIEQYELILAFLQKMETVVGTADAVELQELGATLYELQTQAEQFDRILLAKLKKEPHESDSVQTLRTRHERLLKEVLLANERITAKASGVKSLISHEIGKLRDGLSAMNGYRQQQHNQGRIVNSTS